MTKVDASVVTSWAVKLEMPPVLYNALVKAWERKGWYAAEVDIEMMSLNELLNYLHESAVLNDTAFLNFRETAMRLKFNLNRKDEPGIVRRTGPIEVVQSFDDGGPVQKITISGGLKAGPGQTVEVTQDETGQRFVVEGGAPEANPLELARRRNAEEEREAVEEEGGEGGDEEDEGDGDDGLPEPEGDDPEPPRPNKAKRLTARPTFSRPAPPKGGGLFGVINGFGRKFMPKGWPNVAYTLGPIVIGLFLLVIILAIVGGVLVGSMSSTSGNPTSGPSAFYGVTQSPTVGPSPTATGTAIPDGEVKNLLTPPKIEVNLLARSFTLEGWVEHFPWYLISFILVPTIALAIFLGIDRFSMKEKTDARIVGFSLLGVLVTMVAAEIWTVLLQTMKAEAPANFTPTTIVVFGLVVNLFLCGVASYLGTTDWSAAAIGGLFIPGIWVYAWYNHDWGWAATGLVMMAIGLLVELYEIHRLSDWHKALVLGVVAGVLFYVGIGAGLLVVGGIEAWATKSIKWLTENPWALATVRVFLSGRELIAASFGGLFAVGLGIPLAMIFVGDTPRLGRGASNDRDLSDKTSESSRWDGLALGVMLVVLTVNFVVPFAISISSVPK